MVPNILVVVVGIEIFKISAATGDGIQELEYEIATAMFVLIVIETPIFIGIYKFLNKM